MPHLTLKNRDYPYLYETHLHTRQGSACASNTGEEMVKAAISAGYTGIIITDHNWGGNTCLDPSLPWEEWVDEFSKGYLDAKKYGDKHNFDVFFGYEAGFNGTDFLVYGIDIEWMKSHPELRSVSMEEQFKLIHSAGGIVIHAHPFREDWYIPEIKLYPNIVDGVEGINSTHSCKKSTSHNNPQYDEKAIKYATKYNLPITAGSDVHTTDLFGGGIAFKRKLTSIQDFCKSILNREDYILTNGDNFFNKSGDKL